MIKTYYTWFVKSLSREEIINRIKCNFTKNIIEHYYRQNLHDIVELVRHRADNFDNLFEEINIILLSVNVVSFDVQILAQIENQKQLNKYMVLA